MRAAFAVPLLLALVLAAPANAALNGPLPYKGETPYSHLAALNNLTFISGAIKANAVDARGSYAFFNTTGAHIDGLTQVCWNLPSPDCVTSPEGRLTIVFQPRSSFGMHLPAASSATLTAAHALTLFADFRGETSLNSLQLDRALVASVQGGNVSFTRIAPIPQVAQPNEANSGVAVGLDANTHILVKNGAVLAHSIDCKSAAVFYQGTPKIAPFATDLATLPFEQGSSSAFKPATSASATKGISQDRLNNLFASFQGASSGGQACATPQATAPAQNFNLGNLQPIAAGVLNGALATIPASGAGGGLGLARNFTLVRFTTMTATGGAQSVHLEGKGALQITGGRIAGASPLVGFAVLQAPWWAFGLWLVAIGAYIAVMIVKPNKEHPLWDRFNWVGWVVGPLVILLVAFLWDREVKAVWGVSLLTGGVSGAAMGVVAAMEILPALALLFIVVSPLRIIFRAGLRLAKQGRFMRLSRPLSLLVGYFVAVGLMRTYLDLALRTALGT